jgi:hypothetical protein
MSCSPNASRKYEASLVFYLLTATNGKTSLLAELAKQGELAIKEDLA